MSQNPNEIEHLAKKFERLQRQIQCKDEALRRKNRELDALHFVWCNGGCIGGVHRWSKQELTEDVVELAEANTLRLRQWFNNRKNRLEHEAKHANNLKP